jgi:hypothetical protein
MNNDDGKMEVRFKSRRMRLAMKNSQAVTSHNNDVSITAMHQVAEMIIHLAIPISGFTASPEKYCRLWHKTVGDDIEGLKSMIAHLERSYARIGEIEGQPEAGS